MCCVRFILSFYRCSCSQISTLSNVNFFFFSTKLNYFSLKCIPKRKREKKEKTKIHIHRSNLKHINNKQKKTSIDKMNFEDNAAITSVWIFVFLKFRFSTCFLHKFQSHSRDFRETIEQRKIKFETILLCMCVAIRSLMNSINPYSRIRLQDILTHKIPFFIHNITLLYYIFIHKKCSVPFSFWRKLVFVNEIDSIKNEIGVIVLQRTKSMNIDRFLWIDRIQVRA